MVGLHHAGDCQRPAYYTLPLDDVRPSRVGGRRWLPALLGIASSLLIGMSLTPARNSPHTSLRIVSKDRASIAPRRPSAARHDGDKSLPWIPITAFSVPLLVAPNALGTTGGIEPTASELTQQIATVDSSLFQPSIGAGVLALVFITLYAAYSSLQTPEPSDVPTEWENPVPHPNWSRESMLGVQQEHRAPETLSDRVAYHASRATKEAFDLLAGFKSPPITEEKWLNRVVFLETVAGVPGMVAAAVRHLSSLRQLRRDYGWIHTLLEDAENERMHLLSFMALRQPGPLFRFGIASAQGVFASAFLLGYIISPGMCHRFMGYVEEEAVKSYTLLLAQLDDGSLPNLAAAPCPEVSRRYWHLPDDATFRDLVLAVRADEAHHRLVQHTFAGMRPDEPNPFTPDQPGCVWVCPVPDQPTAPANAVSRSDPVELVRRS